MKKAINITMKNKMMQWMMVTALALSMTASALAQTAESAVAVVKESVTVVLDDLRQNQRLYEQNPVALNRLISTKMLPYFDERAMAVKVLGQHWRTATKQQKEDFIKEFKQLVMRTYSSNLLDYTNATVSYGNASLLSRNRIARVDVNVKKADGKTYPLMLTLIHKKNQWKIMDVSMEGLSVITVYHDALAEEIAQKGLQGIIDEYKALNRNGAVMN